MINFFQALLDSLTYPRYQQGLKSRCPLVVNGVFSGLDDHTIPTHLYFTSSTSIITSPGFFFCPGTIFMITAQEASFIAICLEGFFYGKISVLCAQNCTVQVANDAQLFSGLLGLYSGIFAMYLQCPSKKSTSAIILFYAICLLYILSTATFVCDFVNIILEVSTNSICQNYIIFISVVLYSRVSQHYRRFKLKMTRSQCHLAFRLSKPQQAVVVTSSPNVLQYA